MRCEWLDEYLLSFPGGEKTYQPAWRMFLYKVRGKQFAAVCSPAENYQTYGGHDLVIRPDHGRQLWEEGPGNCRPGYGKYDRALGIQYMLGVWDLLDRLDEEKNK